ncbi:MAG: Rieske (2Fe-2S) protein [Gammaproteobacteria bacterium]
MDSDAADSRVPAAWAEWPVCRLADIVPPGARGFLVGDGDWPVRGFVVRPGDGVFAYLNVCPHARHALDLTPHTFLVPDGTMIRCASHGALFTPETGECVAGPCVGARLMPLPVRVDDGGTVWVRAPGSMRDERLAGWTGL